MRVVEMSLPNRQSSELFRQQRFRQLGEGLDEPRLEKLVVLGGAAGKFGDSLAKVADLHSSTAQEKLFFSASHNFVLAASAMAQGLSNVSIAAPAVNLLTFVSTDAYRRRLIVRSLNDAEPAVHEESIRLETEFDPGNPASFLFVYSQTTAQLDELLESAEMDVRSSDLSANDRYLIANAYRLVGRNRDHIQYVTSHQRQLVKEIVSAYDSLLAEYNRDEAQYLEAVDRCSNSVSKIDLAFDSLK